MSNETLNDYFFNLDLASVCGCRFDVAAGSQSTVIHLASTGTEVTRVIEGGDPYYTGHLLFFLSDVADMFMAGEVEPDMRFRYDSPSFPLSMDICMVAGSTDTVRLKATLTPEAHDSLDYCQVGVTVDLLVIDFIREAHRAATTGGAL